MSSKAVHGKRFTVYGCLFIIVLGLSLASYGEENLNHDEIKEEEMLFPFWEDGKMGYINKYGHIKIVPQFKGAEPFSEGLACVKTDKGYGYIDKKAGRCLPRAAGKIWPFF